jgi:hypothetical protein
LPSASTSGNESVFVALIDGTAGAVGSIVCATSARREKLGAADASGASGLMIIMEMMRHTIKVFAAWW